MVHTDIRDYQVTLVPENYETEVALILLHLQSASQNHDADRPDGTHSFHPVLMAIERDEDSQ